MRRFCVLLAGIAVLAGTLLATAQTPDSKALAVKSGPVYSLDQFGPVEKTADAEATFQKASKDIIASGGGILMIPSNAAVGWKPRNTTQEQWRKPAPPEPTKQWGSLPGVTVVDGRGGTVKINPPQVTGLEIDRVLNLPEGQSLPHWGYYPMVAMKNTILHGSQSYHDWLQEDVKAGKDQKFYVATIRGVFPGEFLNTLSYSAGVQRLYVKSLGYDAQKKMWYFVADCVADVPKGTILSNKNHVNVLSIDTHSHNENQTFDFRIWRRNYSQGDNYLMDARFFYMGDVHSTAGDENGVCYAAFIQSDTNIYRGKVEAWTPATHALKLKTNGATLGSGRPIINMNPAKWITEGTATLGASTRLSADAPVTDDVVGRYFAVDEPNEYVPGGPKIRRWYLIHRVNINQDGTKDLTLVRHWWGAKTMDAPLLYRSENYGKPLKYVIAPGANAYDVSEGVSDPKRTIKLAPAPFEGTPADFGPGDDVEQAIGPDPFRPIPFRTWIWDHVPGKFPAPVFDVANYGPVGRDSLIWVRGGTGSIEKDRAKRADGNPPFDKFLYLDAACNTGIRFGADTASAAILFAQPNNREQPIHWRYGGDEDNKVASLTVKRDTGEFTFKGNGIKVDGPVTTTGLSGDTATPAKNLRGKNVSVKTGETKVTVAFPVPETDENYAVFIEQNWLTNRAIVNKEATGFTVEFEKAAPKDARLDWMLVR
jgi:hypothetical protein